MGALQPQRQGIPSPHHPENGGWQLFNTTPRGRNHAHITLKAAQKDPSAFGQVLDATQTDVFTQAQLDAELKAYIDDFGEEYGKSKFEQEYLCSFDAANLGAILARHIATAEKQGRISDAVVFDKDGADIEISSDIGRRDASTWWFWQPQVGGYQIVDYDGGWGADAEEWCEKLDKRIKDGGYRLRKIWLPHDARAKTFSAKRSAVETFLQYFGEARVGITPQTSKADRINAARILTPRVRFNESKCARGLAGLRSWQFEWKEDTKTFSNEPLHDWASHDGDGYSYGCVVMREHVKEEKKDERAVVLGIGQPARPDVERRPSLDEMWEARYETQEKRI